MENIKVFVRTGYIEKGFVRRVDLYVPSALTSPVMCRGCWDIDFVEGISDDGLMLSQVDFLSKEDLNMLKASIFDANYVETVDTELFYSVCSGKH